MLRKPADFEDTVRKPGNDFLKTAARPIKNEDWKGREFWRRVIPYMRSGHRDICSYSAIWVSKLTGTATIDHYIPRSADPDSAYEWKNLRLSCQLMNSRKKNFRDVLDPFKIKAGWFTIDFDTYMVHPNPTLPAPTKRKVSATIERLKLNDDLCVAARREWYECFSTGCMDFDLLQRRAPHIAFEARRQGLAP